MKRKRAWGIGCVLAVSFVMALSCFGSMQEFVLTKRPDPVDADTVVMLYPGDGDEASLKAAITDPETVSELLSMHNSLRLLYMSRPAAEERIWVMFYQEDEIITEWCISNYEDDGMIVTSSDTFGGGNHVVKSDFCYDRIIEIFHEAIG